MNVRYEKFYKKIFCPSRKINLIVIYVMVHYVEVGNKINRKQTL